MPITTNQFADLTDDLESIFNETKVERTKDVGRMIFEVKKTNRLTHQHNILHGVAGVSEVAEGADLPRVQTEQGDSIIYTQRYFGAIVAITKKMRKFDLHDEIESIVKSITDDAFDKFDQSMADVMLNGWATSYVDVYGKTISAVGPDALALFSASHSNPINATTFSNIISSGGTANPTFSRTAFVAARTAARKYKDPNNVKRKIMLDTIVSGPDLEDQIWREIKSGQLAGTANNDENPEFISSAKIVIWDALASTSGGTDTSAYWFAYDSKRVGESLKCKIAEDISLDAPEQVYSNKDWEFSLDHYYALGLGFSPYIMGSNGTNA